MKGENFNISGKKPIVLVAPLDWGLGHATRCIPIISELLSNGCEVLIGAEGAGLILLQNEFPQLHFIPLRGYRVRYSRKKNGLPVTILLQLPKLFFCFYYERSWLNKIIKNHAIDVVISDNRPGLNHSAVHCIYITHQLTIKTGSRFAAWLAQKIHYSFIKKFDACWVPDAAGGINLAGLLSHPKHLPATEVQYIGPLSRFEKTSVDKIYDLAVILSGPEPQRTIFEEIVLDQLRHYNGTVLLVRGLPGNLVNIQTDISNIIIHNHLSADALNNAIEQSAMVICRSGYTTIMDLVKLQRNAVLVPTPGQTEQVYLAEYLMEKKIFVCVQQSEFSLPEVFRKSDDFSFFRPVINCCEYKLVIENFINSINKS